MSAVTEAMKATTSEVTRETMLAALNVQREALKKEGLVRAETRSDRLNRAINLLLEHRDELIDAMSADFGNRPRAMSLVTDILSSVKPLKHARRHLRSWMKPDKRPLEFPLGMLGGKAYVQYQPKGVVGLISPWNFPVNLTFGPLAGILAAGNRVLIKPSEFTPQTSALMQRLIAEYFDPAEIEVFIGGPEVGQAFSALPFDHLMFTGATSIGRHVMRAASDNLCPVTLELGGKSPVIVGESADIEATAEKIMLGKLMNAGQICLAPDYLFVPSAKKEALLDAFKKSAAEMYPSPAANSDYTSIVNERNAERLKGYVADASEHGARTIRLLESESSGDRTLSPVIVDNVTDEMKVMQEEIFGPILPVKTYDSLDEVIDYINANDRPLGLYYFGEDSAEEERILNETTSGGVTINDVIWHVGQEDLPFGGIGPSGMGSYHGFDGFKEFSSQKAVFRQAKINLANMLGLKPPYSKDPPFTVKRELRK